MLANFFALPHRPLAASVNLRQFYFHRYGTCRIVDQADRPAASRPMLPHSCVTVVLNLVRHAFLSLGFFQYLRQLRHVGCDPQRDYRRSSMELPAKLTVISSHSVPILLSHSLNDGRSTSNNGQFEIDCGDSHG